MNCRTQKELSIDIKLVEICSTQCLQVDFKVYSKWKDFLKKLKINRRVIYFAIVSTWLRPLFSNKSASIHLHFRQNSNIFSQWEKKIVQVATCARVHVTSSVLNLKRNKTKQNGRRVLLSTSNATGGPSNGPDLLAPIWTSSRPQSIGPFKWIRTATLRLRHEISGSIERWWAARFFKKENLKKKKLFVCSSSSSSWEEIEKKSLSPASETKRPAPFRVFVCDERDVKITRCSLN